MKDRVGIVDTNRKIPRNLIAKSSDYAVVIRAAPFPENIWKTVHQNPDAVVLAITEQQLLSGTFALSIGIVQFRLYRGCKHDRSFIPVPL